MVNYRSFFETNMVIHETQIGFQPKASTSDHLFVLRTLIEKYQSLNCNVIKYMYSDNDIHIKVGNSLSEQVRQHIGLRQGDNLSPNLFMLFLNNLSKCFDASDDHVELSNINFSCLMYADDLVLLSTSGTELQSCQNKLSGFVLHMG